MKYLLWLVLVITTLFIPKNTVYASCQRMDNTVPAEQQCKTAGKYPRRDYSLTIAGTAQCTNSPGNGVYAVCCDELTEANAVDSVRAPLCGSSEERGKANSTCYDCGSGNYKCDGLDFSLGSTDPFISQIHNPVNPGDTNMDQVWRIPNASIPSTFTYNGISYRKPSGDLIVCGSNNLACGSSEECSNIIYPDINNRGNNGSTPEKECTTVTRTTSVINDTDINLNARGTPTDVTGIEAKNLIDVGGDNDRGRGPQLSTLIGNSVNTSPDIKGLYQVNLNDGKTPIPKDVENGGNFGVTLLELGTNPNDVILAPKIGYDIGGGYNYTILYASQNDITLKGTLEDNAVYGYTIHLTDFNINPDILKLYNQNQDTGRNQLLAIPCGYPLGTPKDSKVKVAVADTGTFMDPRVRKDWWNVPADVSCANTSPGLVNPLPTQICTEFGVAEAGVPDITTKIPIPNLVSFGQTSTAKDKNGSIFSIFSGIKEINTDRSIGKLFGFKDNKIEVPKVYERLGRQLHGALPFLKPMAIEIQPIAELTHSGASTYCYVNDKQGGKTQAFPRKGTITIPAPGLNQVRESGRFLVGAFGTETISKNELKNLGKLNPNVLAKIDLNPACDEPPTAFTVRQRQVGSSDPEEYEVPEDDWPVYFRSIRVPDFEAILAAFLGKKCGEVDCKIDREPHESNVRFKTKTPYVFSFTKDLVKDQAGKPVGALATLQPAALQTHDLKPGRTEGNTMIQQLGSNWEDMKNVTLNYRNAKTIERDGEQLPNCLLHPLSLQKNLDYECKFNDLEATGVPNTSDWAGTAGTRSGPPAFTPSGPFYELLVQKAEKYDVPQCVMEGVGRIEGGGRYSELRLDQCLETTNTCSAVGPMQFTVGPGHGKATEEACKNSCGAGYCPNAWSTWGNGGNPCRYEDSLDAAARYLAAFGNFSSGDQKQSIHDATTAYYGSDKDATARANLGGCEYWEFVYKQCNPSYVCNGGNVGL